MRSAATWPLPQLPHAEAELRRMNAALNLPGSVVLIGSEATEAGLRALPLARYSVIAFATHGLVSGDLQTLREPALVMTPPAESRDDGLLMASEIATFRLDADWIILSACNTGTGREVGAAGYSGLAKAFLQAGGRNVLVSLWPVRDDAASAISVGTVQAYAKGASQARALRRATLNFMKDKTVAGSAHPRVWAPFSVVTR
jgi:CHAT domain-containing protein